MALVVRETLQHRNDLPIQRDWNLHWQLWVLTVSSEWSPCFEGIEAIRRTLRLVLSVGMISLFWRDWDQDVRENFLRRFIVGITFLFERDRDPFQLRSGPRSTCRIDFPVLKGLRLVSRLFLERAFSVGMISLFWRDWNSGLTLLSWMLKVGMISLFEGIVTLLYSVNPLRCRQNSFPALKGLRLLKDRSLYFRVGMIPLFWRDWGWKPWKLTSATSL